VKKLSKHKKFQTGFGTYRCEILIYFNENLSDSFQNINMLDFGYKPKLFGIMGDSYRFYVTIFRYLQSKKVKDFKIDTVIIMGNYTLAFHLIKNLQLFDLVSGSKIIIEGINSNLHNFSGSIIETRMKEFVLDSAQKITENYSKEYLYPNALLNCADCPPRLEAIYPKKLQDSLDVVIPTRNVSYSRIYRLIELISQQLEPQDKIYLIDDNEKKILLDPNEFISNNPIIILNGECSGISAARNLGIENSLSDLIIFIDSDDYIKEGHISIQRRAHNKFLNLGATGVQLQGYGKINFKYPQFDNMMPHSLISCLPPAGVLMWKRSFLESLGGFNQEFAKGCEDFDLVVRATIKGINIAILDVPTYNYYRGVSSLTTSWTQNDLRSLHTLVYKNIKDVCSHTIYDLVNSFQQRVITSSIDFTTIRRSRLLTRTSKSKVGFVREFYEELPLRIKKYIVTIFRL
jgi:glycosyltransferase involved in cell wall biosynthesis